jgi:hypothetical protein
MEVHDIRKGVKGRKDYECSLCNKDILKGEPSTVLDTYDGEYGHDRVCSFCGEHVQIGDTFDPDDENYLPECRPFPEGCLRVDEGEILERA